MREQVVVQHFICKSSLFCRTCFLVHIHRGIHYIRCYDFNCLFLRQNPIGIDDRCAKRVKHLFCCFIINVKQYVFANVFIGDDTKSAKYNKERNRLLDSRNLHINRGTESVVFVCNHDIDLFRRDAFEVGNGFDFSGPRPFAVVFRSIETINAIFCGAFLAEYCLLTAINNKVATCVMFTFSRYIIINMSILI